MSPLATELEPDAPAVPRHRPGAALLWALAAAVCTCGAWAIGSGVGSRIESVDAVPDVGAGTSARVALGAGYGLLAGVLVAAVGLSGNRFRSALVLCSCGVPFGAVVGFASTLPVFSLQPLANSSLLLAGLGFLAGLGGYLIQQPSSPDDRPRARAARWALAGAASAAGSWALALAIATAYTRVMLHPDDVKDRLTFWSVVFTLTVACSVVGWLAALLIGLTRGRWRTLPTLSLAGLALGVLGGGLSVPVMVACASHLHPLLSSSLLWAALGLLVGLGASYWARPRTAPADPDTDPEEEPPERRVEWLVREPKRPWRDPALMRVLPVPLVSFTALLGAALVESSDLRFTLVAVGALGLSVALVLYKQECRLQQLERRLCRPRDS